MDAPVVAFRVCFEGHEHYPLREDAAFSSKAFTGVLGGFTHGQPPSGFLTWMRRQIGSFYAC